MTTNRDRISDAYDLGAYDQIIKELSREPGPIKKLSAKAGAAISARGMSLYERLPEGATSVITQALQKSLAGVHALIREPAFRSIAHSRVEAKYRQMGAPVTSFEQIQELPLKAIDTATPSLSFNYAAAMSVEGAVAGAAVTGAELIATFGTVTSAGVAAGP